MSEELTVSKARRQRLIGELIRNAPVVSQEDLVERLAEQGLAVTQATEVWQKCEWHRATSTKEFRAHVVRLKLLLAGVYQTLDLLPGVPCQAASPSSPAVSPSIRQEKH